MWTPLALSIGLSAFSVLLSLVGFGFGRLARMQCRRALAAKDQILALKNIEVAALHEVIAAHERHIGHKAEHIALLEDRLRLYDGFAERRSAPTTIQ